MNLSTRIDNHVGRCCAVLPPEWGAPPTGVRPVAADLVGAIRRLDDDSDRVVEWLLRPEARRNPIAAELLVSALAPLAITRCRNEPGLIDEYLTEIVLVAAEVDVADLRRSRRRHASVILDRAWDVVRAPVRRPVPVVPIDPQSFADRPVLADFDDVPDRAVLLDVRAAVLRESTAHPNVVRAWNSVLELSELTPRTRRQKARYSYSLAVVRRYCGPRAAA